MFGEAFMNVYTENNENFKTGFWEIDDCIHGISKGSIVTIGGRPSMGKTSFAVAICNNLLETGKQVLFCELDENLELLERRFIHTKTRLRILRTPCSNMNSSVWNEVLQTINYFDNKPLTTLCKPILTVEEIEEKINEKKPDVVFIDSVQCLKMSKAPNMTEATNLAIKEIKRIASENKIIVVLTSQLSRGTETRFHHLPELSDLRNSSLLEELSDVILLLYRPEYYNHDDIDLKGRAHVLIGKNRFGQLGFVPLYFYNGIFTNTQAENTEAE